MVDVLIFIVLAGLATARITTLIVTDSILEPLRERVFLWSPPPDDATIGRMYEHLTGKESGWIGTGLACHRCVGVWVTLAIVAGVNYLPSVTAVIVVIAAIAQLANLAIEVNE